MTIAKKYFEQQLKNPEFKMHYLNEKEKGSGRKRRLKSVEGRE